MTDSPAFVRNGRLDILAINRLGRALYAPLFTAGAPRPVNIARFQFLDPAGPDFFPDWDAALNTTVSLLRTEAGRAPHDTDLHQPDRRAGHPQRRIPSRLGQAQRAPAPHRPQALPPPLGR